MFWWFVLSVPMKSIAALACLSLAVLPTAADVWGETQRPLPPTALVAESAPGANTLSWQPPLASPGAPVEAYNVYRYVDGVREALGSVNASVTSYVDTDVDPESGYLYFVTAVSAYGESKPSNVAMPGYPWCMNIVPIPPKIPPDDKPINWDCIYPPPGGPAQFILQG
jgi:hypothetical protein